MKIDGKIKGAQLRPNGYTKRSDHLLENESQEDDPKYDHKLLTCSYSYFLSHYLPQWYTKEEIESMLIGVAQLNLDPTAIRSLDLPT
jgi:hypothetical protein